jgi:hypothetical protein
MIDKMSAWSMHSKVDQGNFMREQQRNNLCLNFVGAVHDEPT